MNVKACFFSKLLIGLIIFSLFGCATVFHNPSHPINVNSDPGGAKIYIDGIYVGETPVVYKVDGRKTHEIEFRKEGYKSKAYHLENFVGGGWVVLDIVFGLVPVIVDAATGQWFYPSEDNVKVALEKE